HQRHNAAFLADSGAAVLVPDGELDADRLVSDAARLRDDAVRGAMAVAAHRLGRPDAARVLAQALLALAERRPDTASGAT
ncbi:MAG: hypothetical protein ACRDGJ_00820, partial [Candidatus Limnocylindria bacterium]